MKVIPVYDDDKFIGNIKRFSHWFFWLPQGWSYMIGFDKAKHGNFATRKLAKEALRKHVASGHCEGKRNRTGNY